MLTKPVSNKVAMGGDSLAPSVRGIQFEFSTNVVAHMGTEEVLEPFQAHVGLPIANRRGLAAAAAGSYGADSGVGACESIALDIAHQHMLSAGKRVLVSPMRKCLSKVVEDRYRLVFFTSF